MAGICEFTKENRKFQPLPDRLKVTCSTTELGAQIVDSKDFLFLSYLPKPPDCPIFVPLAASFVAASVRSSSLTMSYRL
jgi:hypothetical protein